MELHSQGFEHNRHIPANYTCEGADRSPPLAWSGAPPATRSFLLVVDDPDAPAGTWSHWALYDIPPSVTRLDEGFSRRPSADGVKQAINDFGRRGYGGPCPPPGHGLHHYHFRLLALDVEHLDVAPDAHCKDVERAAQSHVLERAELVGMYSRA